MKYCILLLSLVFAHAAQEGAEENTNWHEKIHQSYQKFKEKYNQKLEFEKKDYSIPVAYIESLQIKFLKQPEINKATQLQQLLKKACENGVYFQWVKVDRNKLTSQQQQEITLLNLRNKILTNYNLSDLRFQSTKPTNQTTNIYQKAIKEYFEDLSKQKNDCDIKCLRKEFNQAIGVQGRYYNLYNDSIWFALSKQDKILKEDINGIIQLPLHKLDVLPQVVLQSIDEVYDSTYQDYFYMWKICNSAMFVDDKWRFVLYSSSPLVFHNPVKCYQNERKDKMIEAINKEFFKAQKKTNDAIIEAINKYDGSLVCDLNHDETISKITTILSGYKMTEEQKNKYIIDYRNIIEKSELSMSKYEQTINARLKDNISKLLKNHSIASSEAHSTFIDVIPATYSLEQALDKINNIILAKYSLRTRALEKFNDMIVNNPQIIENLRKISKSELAIKERLKIIEELDSQHYYFYAAQALDNIFSKQPKINESTNEQLTNHIKKINDKIKIK